MQREAMLFTLQRYEFFSKSQLRDLYGECRERCCLPYKGTNFSANHNYIVSLQVKILMLFTLQRYEFFSKSQPDIVSTESILGCCLPYKGTNFSANHNQQGHEQAHCGDVVYPTKVRIFQQITTQPNVTVTVHKMLFTLQRYEFFSKSQRVLRLCHRNIDVVYPTKVRIFQQITTLRGIKYLRSTMLFTLQRYEFFSKSQRTFVGSSPRSRCCLPYKGTNFSANHNKTGVTCDR